jgi:hypothetical protein
MGPHSNVKNKHNINGYKNGYSWKNPHTTMNIGHYLISNLNWFWWCWEPYRGGSPT